MEGENEKEVCRLDSVGEFYLIAIFIENETGDIGGQERVCVNEGG